MGVFKIFKNAFLKGLAAGISKEIEQSENDDPHSKIKKVQLGERNWSVWFLETNNGIQLLSIQGYIDQAIPEDGSFVAAFRISEGLTESEADSIMENFKPSS